VQIYIILKKIKKNDVFFNFAKLIIFIIKP